MVETLHLQPPASGPQADPVVFGVACALARIFPVEDLPPRAAFEPSVPDAPEACVEEALAA